MALKPDQGLPDLQTRSLSPNPSVKHMQASSRVQEPQAKPTIETGSQKATEAFIKRVLCPNSVRNGSDKKAEGPLLSELLPPLTSSNDVDLQLYAYIAIIVKECVQSWYGKFTPDQVFVDEIVQIVAHCTRALEERARKTDIESLTMDDIPALLQAHVLAYRTSIRTATPASDTDRRTVYHALRPHPALEKPSSAALSLPLADADAPFRSYCHLLAQGLLAVLLPPGDLQNPCLRALVSEVSADMIIGNFIGVRFAESAFIYGLIRRVADIIQPRLGHRPWAVDITNEPKDRLSRFGLLSKNSPARTGQTGPAKLSELFLLVCQYAVLAFTVLRAAFRIFMAAPSLPSRRTEIHRVSPTSTPAMLEHRSSLSIKPGRLRSDTTEVRPILDYAAWPACADIACLEARGPWMLGSLALLQRILIKTTNSFSKPDGRIDRILANYILRPIFPLSKHLPAILLNLRLSLFPNNAFPTSTGTNAPLDSAAKAALATRSRRAAAFAILNCIPRPLARICLCTSPSSADTSSAQKHTAADEEEKDRAEIEAMVSDLSDTVLAPFEDEYMNRHLVLAIMERVIVALVPELGRNEDVGRGTSELLAERGVDAEGDGNEYDEEEMGRNERDAQGLGLRTNGAGRARQQRRTYGR